MIQTNRTKGNKLKLKFTIETLEISPGSWSGLLAILMKSIAMLIPIPS